MSKLVHIPEAALEQLLREAGRTESVDDYLRSDEVQQNVQSGQRLQRRARAAYWSRFWLFLSAAVSWFSFVTGPDVEGFISGVLLTGMTVVEYKVHHFFLAGDVRGAIYGWWNQCLFAFLFLVYGGYHGFTVSADALSPALKQMADPDLMPIASIVGLEKTFYFTVAIVGSIGQFCLAVYYRLARR